MNSLNKFHPDCKGYGVSPVDPSAGLLKGRKFGGIGFLWKNYLAGNIKVVNTGYSWIVGITIKTSDISIYILGVYLPCDSSNNEDKFLQCLGTLKSMIVNLPSHHVVITGDFNTDHRHHSPFTSYLENFISDNNLCFMDKELLDSSRFTFHCNAWNTTSWLDTVSAVFLPDL